MASDDDLDYDLEGDLSIDRSAPVQEQIATLAVEMRYMRRTLASLAKALKQRDELTAAERGQNRRALLGVASALGVATIGGVAAIALKLVGG